ncbi:NACHT domain-containing protein [Microbispora amethystogenes]|uniref:NACHT domain-containing protein n=1 Tax=Microbispora amethystogenes TaxID=1427754 RepID=A0ABQ4FJ44_9ACTN|nr:NACHT domain-containing protein [Microbispora amethystogenes]
MRVNRRRSWIVLPAAALCVAALGAAVVVVFRAVSATDSPNVADAVAVALAAVTSGVALLGWARNRAAPRVTLPDQVSAAKDTLTALVRDAWRGESMIRGLEPDPIPVVWQLTDDTGLLHHRHLIGEGRLEGVGNAVAELARDFLKLRRRRLVITGGPGAGKTTLAIQLLLELTGKERDPSDPVPVLLSLSSWDPAAEDLRSWLTRSLERGYEALGSAEFGSGVARELVRGGHILPVMDGLDELPRPHRAAIVRALNASLDAAESYILTSRTEELAEAVEDAKQPLPSAAVIAPAPLTPADAEGYLRTCLPPEPGPVWENVLEGLRTGELGGLSQLTATPLGVWLLRAVYIDPHADPAPLAGLLGQDQEELRGHLWDGLIPVLLAARSPGASPTGRTGPPELTPRHGWDAGETRRHLSYLARLLSRNGTRDLAWWRLGELVLGADERRRAATTACLVVGGIFGTVATIAGEIHPLVALPTGFAAGFGVLTATLRGFTGTPGRVSVEFRGRVRDLAQQITIVLLLRILIGMVSVSGAALVAKAEPGLAIKAGFWAGFALGPGLVLIRWMQQPTPLTAATTPYHAWRASRALAILCGVVPGVGGGVVTGLVGGLANGPWFGIKLGVLSGAFLALELGLTMLRHSVWPAYLITVRHLAEQGKCPKDLMDFLDDAHRLGLLRVVGPVYQFRHADLQDHLAAGTRLTARPRQEA